MPEAAVAEPSVYGSAVVLAMEIPVLNPPASPSFTINGINRFVVAATMFDTVTAAVTFVAKRGKPPVAVGTPPVKPVPSGSRSATAVIEPAAMLVVVGDIAKLRFS